MRTVLCQIRLICCTCYKPMQSFFFFKHLSHTLTCSYVDVLREFGNNKTQSERIHGFLNIFPLIIIIIIIIIITIITIIITIIIIIIITIVITFLIHDI